MAERRRHVRACAIRPHGALGDLAGQLDHAAAQRREHDRWKPADLTRVLAHVGHELPDVLERLAGAEPEPLVSRPVAHADPEPEAAARQLVDDRDHLRVLEGVARVDVGDAGAEGDLARRERERLTEGQAVAGARAVQTGEPLALEALGHLERCTAPTGHRDETHRRLWRHSGEYTASLPQAPRPHYDRRGYREEA